MHHTIIVVLEQTMENHNELSANYHPLSKRSPFNTTTHSTTKNNGRWYIVKRWVRRRTHIVRREMLVSDEVISWKRLPICKPFIRGMHQSPIHRPIMMSFYLLWIWICLWTNSRMVGNFDILRNMWCHCNLQCAIWRQLTDRYWKFTV